MNPPNIDALKQSLEDILQRISQLQQILDDLHQQETENEVSAAKLKPIDWNQMPKGIWVEPKSESGWLPPRRFAGCTSHNRPQTFGESAKTVRCWDAVRLIEQPEVTYWPGGECPVPKGVKVEVHFRDGGLLEYTDNPTDLSWDHYMQCDNDIIGYRILGLVPGYCNYPGEKL